MCSMERPLDKIKSEYKLQKNIPVEIFDFYGYHDKYGNHHPRNLLTPSKTEWYCSKLVREMRGNYWCQPDWIIFRIVDDDCLYVPSAITILNHNAGAAVKYMSIFIGDAEKDEWYRLGADLLDFKMQNEEKQTQELNYDAISWDFNLIKSKQFQYLKVKLLDNHMGDARRFGDSCNFLFYHLSFSGYCLPH